MTLYYDRVLLRAGATPGTYDGDGDITLNDKAKHVHAVIVSMSESIYTTDEGVGMAIKVRSSQIPTGEAVLRMGWIGAPGPVTNSSVKHAPVDILAVDWPVNPNTTFTIDISSLGGTQTGTLDTTVSLVYSDGNAPSDIINRIGLGIVPLGGGNISRDDAVATTAETAMPTFTIPETAREIIGAEAIIFLDGAVTASEEITGYVRVDLGISDQTPMNIPLSCGIPGLGTEIEGGNITMNERLPMHIPLPGRELTVRPYANLASAITGGAQVILALYWRY